MDALLKLLITVLLSIYIILVSLRPSVKNPEFIFILYEYPLILILLLALAYYIFVWDERIGYLFFIFLIAIYFDIVMLIKNPRE